MTQDVKSNKLWFSNYRAIQVLYRHINEFIGSTLLPVTFNFIISSTVLAIYIIVRVDASVPITMCMATYAIVCFVFLGTVMGQMSVLTDMSLRAIREKGSQMGRHEYNVCLLRTCTKISVHIGFFRIVDVSVTSTAMNAILTYSVTLLLALKR